MRIRDRKAASKLRQPNRTVPPSESASLIMCSQWMLTVVEVLRETRRCIILVRMNRSVATQAVTHLARHSATRAHGGTRTETLLRPPRVRLLRGISHRLLLLLLQLRRCGGRLLPVALRRRMHSAAPLLSTWSICPHAREQPAHSSPVGHHSAHG